MMIPTKIPFAPTQPSGMPDMLAVTSLPPTVTVPSTT